MNQKELGDWQTPLELAQKCLKLIKYNPSLILEPTCGEGTFLEASLDFFNCPIKGYDINKNYLKNLKKRIPKLKNNIKNKNFYDLDLEKILKTKNPLVIGNPPWVTNSDLGVLNSSNLPTKSNLNKLSGYDSMTGKSNFDISEHMIDKLTNVLRLKKGMLAMLCKTNVARKVFLNNYKKSHIASYKIYKIDSKKYFNVSVDACFFIIDYSKNSNHICRVYEDLETEKYTNIGIIDNRIIFNIDDYLKTKDLVEGKFKKWRSGVKHDCSKVMELIYKDNNYYNGFNKKVSIEDEYIYPLLKSSDVYHNKQSKYVIIPQKKIGEDTSKLKIDAPKLYAYLTKYSNYLNQRKSSIYKNQPKYSIFGIGDYSFYKYKIAISSFYKEIRFQLIKPIDSKPVMVDDTCYILGFNSKKEAQKYLNKINSKLVCKYLKSVIFLDSKRIINLDILNNINLDNLK